MSSSGHVAIVTGSAQGIGFEITKALLKEGYKVCVSDVNEEKGKESVEALQESFGVDRVIFVTSDVRSEEQFQDVFVKTIEKFGQVNVLVNNAGIANELDPKSTVDVNLMGTIHGCQSALKYMSKSNGSSGGIVVNIASIYGLVSSHKIPVYTATKHAVIGLTRCYGSDFYLQDSGILFMAICPYFVRTSILETCKLRADFGGIAASEIPNILEPDYVAEGVLKVLHEKQNGCALAVLPGKFLYVGYPEEMKDTIAF